MHSLSTVCYRLMTRVPIIHRQVAVIFPPCAASGGMVSRALISSPRAMSYEHSGQPCDVADDEDRKFTTHAPSGETTKAGRVSEPGSNTSNKTSTSSSNTAHDTAATRQGDATGGFEVEGTRHVQRPNANAFSLQHQMHRHVETTATCQTQRMECLGRCSDFKLQIEGEMRAEIARDSAEGFAAVPPLTPAGWAVNHRPGTNFFFMHKVFDSDALSAMPRYRSVEEELRRGHGTGRTILPPARSRSGSRARWRAQEDDRYVQGVSMAERHGKSTPTECETGHKVPRSKKEVIVFAPFRVQDLSLYDYNVAICEWACFDLLVRKHPPASLDASASHKSEEKVLPRGQRRVWDEQQCLFVRLASVNSELRLRSVQLLSCSQARALERYAALGKGEPYYLELLRRLRTAAGAANAWMKQSGRSHAAHFECSSSEEVAWLDDGRTALLDDAESEQAGAAVLTTAFDTSGEVARSLCYAGPYLTELSKELHEALLSYVMTDLGITAEVAEYVCQMQYFLEQEEYMSWLARCSQFADDLSSAAGVDGAKDDMARLNVAEQKRYTPSSV